MSAHPKLHFLTCAVLMLGNLSATASVCPSSSEIDQVPAFIAQIYSDILNRAPDPGGQRNWASQLQTLNSRQCGSSNPSLLAGTCEWTNAAHIALAVLSSAESAARNGNMSSDVAFVKAGYRALLRREPREEGLKLYQSSLQSSGNRQSVVYSLLSSDEYRRRFHCVATSNARNVAVSAAPTGAGWPFELGINGHPLSQKAYSAPGGVDWDNQLQQVHDAGAQWYRMDIPTLRTGQDFTQADSLLKKAQDHGVNLLPVLAPTVDRQHDSPTTIYQKAHDQAFKVVQHYKASIHVWELSNEQDNQCLIRGTSGERPGDYDPQKYAVVAALLRGLADGVHEADPSASRIIDYAGWLHTGFFEKLEADRIPYEIAGIHWYGDYGEITCAGESLPCPARPKHYNVIQRIQSITRGKPIWMTETNYRPGRTNEEMHSYLSRVFQKYASAPSVYPFKVIVIYELLDEPELGGGPSESQMGLFSVRRDASGKYAIDRPKPAIQVLKNLREPR